jgi:hypothetical protein
MTIENKLQLFVNELNDIADDNLRMFAAELIGNAPDYFFVVPASSSKKYHPYFAREEGGLVKHTRCVVFYAECNAESFNLNQHEKDLLIIAAIAHDIKKQGNENNGKHTVWEHPELASNYVLEMQKKHQELINKNDAEQIANAVIAHMGKWAHNKEFIKNKKQYPLPQTLFDYALQSADYVASRNELLNFDFKNTENITLNLNNDKQINEQKNVENNLFEFGKHKGKTVKYVVDNDIKYVEWMMKKTDFIYKTTLNYCKEYIKQNNIKL